MRLNPATPAPEGGLDPPEENGPSLNSDRTAKKVSLPSSATRGRLVQASPRDLFGRAPARPSDRNAEARLQASAVQFIRLAAPQCLCFSVPNGGWRSKAEGARLKWTGTLAGIPDVIVIAPVGRIFFLEFKTKTGRLSPAQRAVFDQLVAHGAPCAIIRSLDDVLKAFDAWGIPMRLVR